MKKSRILFGNLYHMDLDRKGASASMIVEVELNIVIVRFLFLFYCINSCYLSLYNWLWLDGLKCSYWLMHNALILVLKFWSYIGYCPMCMLHTLLEIWNNCKFPFFPCYLGRIGSKELCVKCIWINAKKDWLIEIIN